MDIMKELSGGFPGTVCLLIRAAFCSIVKQEPTEEAQYPSLRAGCLSDAHRGFLARHRQPSSQLLILGREWVDLYIGMGEVDNSAKSWPVASPEVQPKTSSPYPACWLQPAALENCTGWVLLLREP